MQRGRSRSEPAPAHHVERTTVDGYEFNPMYSGLYYYPMDKE